MIFKVSARKRWNFLLILLKMKFTKLFLLNFLFLYIFGISVYTQTDNRISATWQVRKYDLTATLPTSNNDRNLVVKAILDLKNISSGAASRLTLRISDKAEIAGIKINNTAADFSKGVDRIDANRNLQQAVVKLSPVAPNAAISVEVSYKLKVDENNGLRTLTPLNAHFLPLAFWYPTPNSWFFARGADYAPFKIKINAGNGLTALSSGAETTNEFEQKLSGQPFFIAGKWDKIEANGVSVYQPKGAGAESSKRAVELTALASEAKTFMATLLGTAPDTPLKIVAVNRGAGFSGGGTIFVDSGVFRRQKIDSQTAMNIAESIAKIWLGNAVSIGGDGAGVIREGLPRFIATEFLENKFGKDIADIERLKQRTAYAAVAKRDAPLNIASPLDDFYFVATANKGAMVWRALAKKIGRDEFFEKLRRNMEDKDLQLSELRDAYSAEKSFLDYSFDQVSDLNFLVGLPQASANETKVALRNTGSIDVNVPVTATTANGEKIPTNVTLKAKSFGEVVFKSPNKIVRVEIDSDKIYPQTEYFDDISPRAFSDSDLLLVVKRDFDKQDFAAAEKNARSILNIFPRYDDVRILLARSLSAQNKSADAEKEFQIVLDEKLPTARSLAWTNVGLGEIASKNGRNTDAIRFFNNAITADAEYGATLAARAGRSKLGGAIAIDESVKAYFAQFDKAAVSNQKAQIESLILPGEVEKFAAGIAGQAQQWSTQVLQTDKIDEDNIWVETALNIKLINRNAETGTAIYRLTKVGNDWKLSGVEIFEVR